MILGAAAEAGFRLDSAIVGAVATMLTVAVGWYTARNARKAQSDTHSVATHEQGRADQAWIVEASRELALTIQGDLERIRNDLAEERELREQAQTLAQSLRVELGQAEKRIDTLMGRLDEAHAESERLRAEMDALRAEMRAYRNGTRDPDAHTRWDDT